MHLCPRAGKTAGATLGRSSMTEQQKKKQMIDRARHTDSLCNNKIVF